MEVRAGSTEKVSPGREAEAFAVQNRDGRRDGVRTKGLMDVRTWQAVAAVVIVSLIACGAAVAEPTLNGFTGLFTIPTADTLDQGVFNVGLNSGELQDWDDWNYYANFGVGSETEVGVLAGDSDTLLSLKRSLTTENGGPSIAAGVFDVTDSVETTVYVVASWQQGRSVGTVEGREVNLLDIHAGFAAGMIQDFFAGLNLRFGPHMQIMGEWADDDFNIAVRFSPTRNVTVDAGFLDMDDIAANVSYQSTF